MKAWYKLDNAAKIYPPTQTADWAAMFRVSVTLTEPVDPALLIQAQENALKRFPSFACGLRKGLFWYYLEQLDGAPPLCEDIWNPMQKIQAKANRHFLYRLLLYKNRIAVEFFHTVTDGTGGITFLLSLTAEYLRLRYGLTVPSSDYILSCAEEPRQEEIEDAFLRYARKATLSRKDTPAYRLSGTPTLLKKLLIISGKVPTARLKEEAEAHGVTVGVFLASVLLWAVYQTQIKDPRRSMRSKDVKISIPVNLRRYFPSRTLRNFSSYVTPGISGRFGEYTLDEIMELVQHYMGLHVTGKELNARFSGNVVTENNTLLRASPLVLKNIALRLGYLIEGPRYYTTTISNLGMISLPQEMAHYVQGVDFMLGRSLDERTGCACVSYSGQTTISFTRAMLETDVERYFFTKLIAMGIPVELDSNGRN